MFARTRIAMPPRKSSATSPSSPSCASNKPRNASALTSASTCMITGAPSRSPIVSTSDSCSGFPPWCASVSADAAVGPRPDRQAGQADRRARRLAEVVSRLAQAGVEADLARY